MPFTYNAGATAEGTQEIWASSPCPATLSSEQMPLSEALRHTADLVPDTMTTAA